MRLILLVCCASLALTVGVATATGAATTLSTCYGNTPTITGTTDAGETILGTPGDDVIVAGGGPDIIDASQGGHDIICAGGGDDLVFSTNDPVTIAGEDGDDTLESGAGNDYIDGGRGTDDCLGGGGTDRIYGCTNPSEFVVGQSAPDLVARTAFDNRFRLANFLGQNVMINFSSMWCSASNSMGLVTASVQTNLRNAGVPFTYVLGEVENTFPGTASVRADAELMSEFFGLNQLPVLHAEGSFFSQLTTQQQEYQSENFAYDPAAGTNNFFPMLVFINASGVVTDISSGSLTGQQIEDHYMPGLPAPTTVSTVSPSLVGVDLENERSLVDALTITASVKQTLAGQLTNALHALDLWLKPKTSACDWMKQFDGTLKKTRGIGTADLASLQSGSQGIESKLGCKTK